MSTKQIAEWMGISYNTFRKQSANYLNKLSYFAEFEKIYGGVIITKIMVPEYIKDLGEWDAIYLDLVLKSNEGLCSVAGMVRVLLLQDKYKDINPSTIKYHLTKAGYRQFGKITEEDKCPYGASGSRHYVWAIKLSELNEYRFRTKEEDEFFTALKETYAIKHADKIENEALFRDAYNKSDITEVEFIEFMKQDDFYQEVIVPFREQTGFTLVRATVHDVAESVLARLDKIFKFDKEEQ